MENKHIKQQLLEHIGRKLADMQVSEATHPESHRHLSNNAAQILAFLDVPGYDAKTLDFELAYALRSQKISNQLLKPEAFAFLEQHFTKGPDEPYAYRDSSQNTLHADGQQIQKNALNALYASMREKLVEMGEIRALERGI